MMKSIDGRLLKEMLLSASNNLYNHYPEIDALNVFPVPDGDTGMNMNLTLSSGAKEIQNRNDDDIYAIASSFARGLLMGARGNSGVITSQIFRGVSASLKEKKIMKTMDFVEAFQNGAKTAYKAVMRPVEGTILTVIREAAESLSSSVKEDMSLEKAMELFLKEARLSLERTPQLLPVLKEVGVVDSGGAGLVCIIEGMNSALRGTFIEKNTATSVDNKGGPLVLKDGTETGYIVEFVLKLGPSDVKKAFVENRFTSVLASRGSDVKCSVNNDLVKVSMVSLLPGGVLSYAQTFGEFADIKIENRSQDLKNIETIKEEVATKDIPLKDFAMVSISAGNGLSELFKEMGVDQIVRGGQTMNPSIEDIASAIKETHAKNVFVFPNNSNIIMAALQAADLLNGEINVLVVPTKTMPQGLVSVSAFNPDATASQNYEEMKKAIKNVKSGAITYAIKDTVIDGVKVTKDYFMGILDKKIVTSKKVCEDALLALLDEMIDDDSFLLTLLIGEDVSKEIEEKITKKIHAKYAKVDIDIKRGDQPVYSYLIGVE